MTVSKVLKTGFTIIVDDEDKDLLDFSWYAADSRKAQPHIRRDLVHQTKRYRIYLHRQVMERVLNRQLETKEQVDHIDENPLNNRRSNLRLADKGKNMMNCGKRSNNKVGYKGVYFDKARKKYVAMIGYDGKKKQLGRYDTAEDAYEAYKAAARKYHGEFAKFD